MIRTLVASLVLATMFVPAGVAFAEPDDITKPAAVLRSADRTGNRVSMVPAPEVQPADPGVSSEMQAVLDLVNVERTMRGLVALRFSSKLNDAALDHTRNQAADGEIYHTDPDDGSNTGQRISREGYEFSTWGENVAAGYPTAETVVDAWMKSSGHCHNILTPGFTELGVGYVTGGVTYDQFWTQNFARPAGEPRPAGTYDPAWC